MQLNVTTRQLVTLRLIVPGNQCGSLIGKGGANIKAIRQVVHMRIAYFVLTSLALNISNRCNDAVITRRVLYSASIMNKLREEGEGRLKMQEWKYRHDTATAGIENYYCCTVKWWTHRTCLLKRYNYQ